MAVNWELLAQKKEEKEEELRERTTRDRKWSPRGSVRTLGRTGASADVLSLVLLQPGPAVGRAPGGVPAVPAQPTALPLPPPHFLFAPGVLGLPAPVPAHRDLGEPRGHRLPAVLGGAGAAGRARHPGRPGAAGALRGVPAEAFSGRRSRHAVVPGARLQVIPVFFLIFLFLLQGVFQ